MAINSNAARLILLCPDLLPEKNILFPVDFFAGAIIVTIIINHQ